MESLPNTPLLISNVFKAYTSASHISFHSPPSHANTSHSQIRYPKSNIESDDKIHIDSRNLAPQPPSTIPLITYSITSQEILIRSIHTTGPRFLMNTLIVSPQPHDFTSMLRIETRMSFPRLSCTCFLETHLYPSFSFNPLVRDYKPLIS